ncbi:hypothetical protein BGZ99_009267 [Dissophora globulifera]|uniref:Uncharacterized protein n=1 Tax=Dissophora globulifera TaxID=979702 RepID=A0A9P6UME3_9FUNG|nr:hypothetical protein BGZ99_009267 [Dissophora globulifera]
MDEYQMLQQNGVQELVAVSLDEDSVPCIFLRDMERIFPNITTISSYGKRIPFAKNAANVPKQPLRIPYFENHVLDVESDNSSQEWSREATTARLAAAVASISVNNTVHTSPVAGLLDSLDVQPNSSDRGNSAADTGSDDPFNLAEPEVSSSNDNNNNNDHADEAEEAVEESFPLAQHSRPPRDAILLPAAAIPTTRTLRTVQSLDNMLPEDPTPIPTPVHTPLTQETAFTPPASSPATTTTSVGQSAHFLGIPEESEDGDEALPPPSYEPVDTSVPDYSAEPEHPLPPIPSPEELAERQLLLDRMENIKRTSLAILSQKYEAESCPHPPLFILLPENPLQWSVNNILHNKMRLHFLCDCCERELALDDTPSPRLRSRNRRIVHVNESKGFEIRLDQFQDQLLLMKFGHYILCLLQMLKYGFSVETVFVPAAFDRPVPPVMSTDGTVMDPQLVFRPNENIERSIVFMQALLGNDYNDVAAEAVAGVDMNDFRLLDCLVKRLPYAQPAKTESSSMSPSSSPSTAALTDMDRDLALSDVHLGGSGLYKTFSADERVRWSCKRFYQLNHENIDTVFTMKLDSLKVTLDRHTRSAVVVGTSEQHLNTRITETSKIKELLRLEFLLDWDFDHTQLDTLADLLRRNATAVSTIAVRFGKRVPPLGWKNNLPISNKDQQQPISAILNLVKNHQIRHLILEGDIDLTSVPNIETMDFSNLDILSVMKTNNRGYGYGISNSSGDSTESNLTLPANRPLTQDTYIPQLISFLQSCSLLTELSLGFPDVIPGHIRILQACTSVLSGLKRLDLFRILGTRFVASNSGSSSNRNGTHSNNDVSDYGGSVINRKLELSADFSATLITRLYLAECKATGEAKTKLLESLGELLTDNGSHIEDLELRYIGFNDRHAHALELGTRPLSADQHCRLRRLVIHGKGLEQRGVSALRRVLKRATRPQRLGRPLSLDSSAAALQDTNSATVPEAVAPLTTDNQESMLFGTMWDQPTLTHLELKSIDSLTDSDWESLLSDLNLRHLITLDLQGVMFSDRAIAVLAHSDSSDTTLDPNSPPHSPTSESSTIASSSSASSLPAAPPAFFSSFSTLQLQTLRLSCSALTYNGVGQLQDLLSRLTHLSTISLHGFRKVTSADWIDIMGRIAFRWIEVVEIVSSGYDDACAQYLGERIRAREQTSESAVSTIVSTDTTPDSAATATASASTTSITSSSTRVTRRESFSFRHFGTPTISSTADITATGLTKLRSRDSNGVTLTTPSLPSSAVSAANPKSSQKYLEIDLRYTDVSSKGLARLRESIVGQAKKVVVCSRDSEDEDGVEGDGTNELAQWTIKPNEDKRKSEERLGRNGKARAVPLSPTKNSFLISHSGIGSFPSSSVLSGPSSGGGGGSSNANYATTGQQMQHTKSPSTFMKLRSAFKKN